MYTCLSLGNNNEYKGKIMKIKCITESNLSEFVSLNKKENSKYIIPLGKWLAQKKKIMPCFAVYGFNPAGELLLKEFLVDRVKWINVYEVNPSIGLL